MESRTPAPARKIAFAGPFACLLLLAAAFSASAQTANQAWLRYSSLPGSAADNLDFKIRTLGQGELEKSASSELMRGILGLSSPDRVIALHESGMQVLLGTLPELRKTYPELTLPADLQPDDYWLATVALKGRVTVLVAGANEYGVLYGAFALLREISQHADLTHLTLRDRPAFPIRWVDEWDNLDGSIERGYGGRSIFFEGGNVRSDLAPVAEYARLLASIGINGCNLNNVNAAPELLDAAHLKQLARIADAMRPWGVHIAISVALASPQKIGGLQTSDPLDPAVKAWWAAKVNEIYTLIPDLAGFTVKADSEGQPGPSSYGRTPADAANLFANALAPHGGVVLYRAFVYNNHLDWRDPKADRARAAYDIFHPLDGKFAPNVIVQVKEGPIDFQAREPVSPLFAGLRQTGQVMELQITQEYTGQQRHLVYLAPMWKQVLDFDLRAANQSTPVKQILSGQSFRQPLLIRPSNTVTVPHPFRRFYREMGGKPAHYLGAGSIGGMVGVACVGRDWLGSPLAMANLYAFGRLAWNPDLAPEQIAREWTRQTIDSDPEVVDTVTKMLMQSWPAYEAYTGPLGAQTLTDITGSHYGPNIESSERNGWGQWHDADAKGIGKDRSVATGSGYAGQYPPEVAQLYENLATTPDNLLLFFHHVPYTYRLHSGKTVIQHIYDSHYDGAAQAAKLASEWKTLEGRIDQNLYDQMRDRLRYQAGHAIVWRDAIVQYFLKLSGIPDDKGRAGHYPGRLEAESARLAGYKIIDVTPWEDASGGKAVSCDQPQPPKPGINQKPFCTAEWTWKGAEGMYDIAVQYFDLQPGKAEFFLQQNGQLRLGPLGLWWTADAALPSKHPHGDNSTRHLVRRMYLKPGDVIGIRGIPDQNDPAALDYIEVTPATRDKALITDLPCAEGNQIEEGDGPAAVNETVGPQLAGWAGYTNVGTPAEAMQVQVFRGDEKTPIATTSTNEEGGFRFPGLAPGRYTVRATDKGIFPVKEIVRLDPNAKAQLCLVVEASGPE